MGPVPLLFQPRRRFPSRIRILLRYLQVLLGEFRWTLVILASAVMVGTFLHVLARPGGGTGSGPSVGVAIYAAWMALFAQPMYSPQSTT